MSFNPGDIVKYIDHRVGKVIIATWDNEYCIVDFGGSPLVEKCLRQDLELVYAY